MDKTGAVKVSVGQRTHRWWTALSWREAECLYCGARYVDWFEASKRWGSAADVCPPERP